MSPSNGYTTVQPLRLALALELLGSTCPVFPPIKWSVERSAYPWLQRFWTASAPSPHQSSVFWWKGVSSQGQHKTLSSWGSMQLYWLHWSYTSPAPACSFLLFSSPCGLTVNSTITRQQQPWVMLSKGRTNEERRTKDPKMIHVLWGVSIWIKPFRRVAI